MKDGLGLKQYGNKMERRDSIFNIQTSIRRVLYGKDREEPINDKTGKESEKDSDPRKKKQPQKIISPQSNLIYKTKERQKKELRI